MARTFEWLQTTWAFEVNDNSPHSLQLGDGILNVTGRTITRIVGRAHMIYTNNASDAKAKPMVWGIAHGGGPPDPITDANHPTFAQRWQIWSMMLAGGAPGGDTGADQWSYGQDTYEFDVHGQRRLTEGTPLWLVWHVSSISPFTPNELCVFSATLRIGYLLPA